MRVPCHFSCILYPIPSVSQPENAELLIYCLSQCFITHLLCVSCVVMLLSYLGADWPPLSDSSEPFNLPWIVPVFSGLLIMSSKCTEEPLPEQLCFLLHLCHHLLNSLQCRSLICNFRAHIFVFSVSLPVPCNAPVSACSPRFLSPLFAPYENLLRPPYFFWMCLIHAQCFLCHNAPPQMLLIPLLAGALMKCEMLHSNSSHKM